MEYSNQILCDMKQCNYCGTPIEDDSVFCSSCGKKIELPQNTCPHCGAELEDDSAFCFNCGASLQATPEVNTNQVVEIQGANNAPKNPYLLWYIIGTILFLLFFACGIYAIMHFKNTPQEETETPVTVVNDETAVDDVVELSLVGDADGFPLELTLSIVDGYVSGLYRNVNHGITMKVTGTMNDNVISLEGTADNANYAFQIIDVGKYYTGTFGRVNGKKMKLYLRDVETLRDDDGLESSDISEKRSIPIEKKESITPNPTSDHDDNSTSNAEEEPTSTGGTGFRLEKVDRVPISSE